MLEKKYAELQRLLREMETVVVAFSGGVDSTFLLQVACGASVWKRYCPDRHLPNLSAVGIRRKPLPGRDNGSAAVGGGK